MMKNSPPVAEGHGVTFGVSLLMHLAENKM
jgi:hypothetical protein